MENKQSPNVPAALNGFSLGRPERGYTATDDLFKFVATDDLARRFAPLDLG